MPSVLIVSDSHGLTEEVQLLKDRHAHEVDGMIHCGDSELDYKSAEMDAYIKVKGNCDFDDEYPEEVQESIQNMSFFVTHGHLFRVKSTLMPLSYRAEERGAQIICFGHSHIAGAEMVDGKLFINPGSIRLPRNHPEKTYAIVSWNEEQSVRVQFYNDQGEVIPGLTYETTFLGRS
ncbi:metallophosphatase [Pontibacillus chungwhensis BH030062]|uniref:Phosphoesterase n=1 Tax=Pontibacillus chungwhensis BH030062 TaxID=1385513 RepID=A0A0A2UWM5_9BACI|nr:metallophosphoesterase [Pontibacillus chungwhensis]KGP90901.1 metallophosphatase [Pontibacillus chungwhensis BH030062]